MRAIEGIIAIVLVACTGPTEVGPPAVAQVAQQTQATHVTVLKVEGMTWAGCEAAVKLAAKTVDGVKDCKANYKTGTAEVTYDPSKTTPEAIAKVISEKTGFKATSPKKSGPQ